VPSFETVWRARGSARRQAPCRARIMATATRMCPRPRVRPPCLAATLVLSALVTMAWSAAWLQPASGMLGDVASGWRPLQEEFSFQLNAQFETVSESFMLRQLARSFLAAPWLLPDNGRSRSWRPTPVEGWAFPSQELDEEGVEHGGEDELEEGVMLSKSASVVVTKSTQQARRQEFQQQRQDQEEWGGNRFTSTDDPYSTDGSDDFVGDGDETEDETGWQRGSLTGEEAAKAEALSDAEAATEEEVEVVEEDETAALEATETEAEAQRSEAELLAQPDATGIVKANGSEVVILYRGDDEEDGASGELADETDGHVANVTAVEKARVRGSSARSARSGGMDGRMRQHLALCERDWLCVVSASRLRRKARFEQLWLQQPLLMPASGAPRDDSGSHPSATAPRANGTALGTAPRASGTALGTAPRANGTALGTARAAAAAAASPNASASATDRKVGSAPGDPKRNGTDETGDPKRNGTDDGIGGGWFALRAMDNGRLVQMLPPDDEEAWVIRAAGAVTSAVTSGAAELGGGAFNVAANASAASGLLVVTALELWRQEGLALRNLGTGALLNFRGADIGGDGTSVRGHGDTKPRTAAWRRTPRTRFVVEPIPSERRKPGGFLRKPKRRKKRDPDARTLNTRLRGIS